MQSPTTTGDSARGRSISALTSGLAGTRPRTRVRAAATPKRAFSGTAMAVIRTVSQRACSASGLVTASQKVPAPRSKVRHMTKTRGATRISPR